MLPDIPCEMSKGPNKNSNCGCKEKPWNKTWRQRIPSENKIGDFCCVGLDGYASYGIQQPVQPTWTYPQNLGPPKIIHTSLSLSDNISSAFDNFSWISRAQHFWDKSPWLVSRPVRPGCAREMELRCLSPKTTKWNEFFFRDSKPNILTHTKRNMVNIVASELNSCHTIAYMYIQIIHKSENCETCVQTHYV